MINNPQAYPYLEDKVTVQGKTVCVNYHPGMTLLDHYAGLAMQSLLTAYYINPEAKKALDGECFVNSLELAEKKDIPISITTMISKIAHGQAINMLKVRQEILTKIERTNATETGE